MANIRRILAGITARGLATLLNGLTDGDVTWLARTLHADRDTAKAKALAHFSQVYYDIFFRNCSGDITANGETALLGRLSRHSLKTVIDVGANVGQWTVSMKQACPNAAVHAFEVHPETAGIYRTTTSSLTNVFLNEVGLGDTSGEIRFWYSPGNSVLTSSFAERLGEFPELKDTFAEVVGKIVRGDDYLAEHDIDHVDFLKIDVEGMEMSVFKGLEGAFARQAIDIVQFEYAPLNRYIPLLLRDLQGFLETRGFVVGKVYPKGVLFKSYEQSDEDFLGLTYIACHTARPDLIETLRYRAPAA